MNFARDAAASRERIPKPAYFGVTANTDFNYEEMQSFELWLTQHDIPHRIRSFDGGHAWPPDALFAEALEWFELRAQLTALAAADSGTIHAEAWQRWREIAADYHSVIAAAEVRRLASRPATRRAINLRRELNRRFFEFHGTLSQWVLELRRAGHPPDVKSAVKSLRLEQRLRDAHSDDRDRARAAQRELEHAYVLFSFDEPRTMLRENHPAHARLLIDLAELIKPGTIDRLRRDPRFEELLRNVR